MEILLITFITIVFCVYCYFVLKDTWEFAEIRGIVTQIINVYLNEQYLTYGNDIKLINCDVLIKKDPMGVKHVTINVHAIGQDTNIHLPGIQIYISDIVMCRMINQIRDYLKNHNAELREFYLNGQKIDYC